MVRGIDMSVVMKNIDEAAKIMKNKEASLALQQQHANVELVEENKVKNYSVIKTDEAHMPNIDPNKKEKKADDKGKKQRKKSVIDKRSRQKDPNKGRWLDVQI